MIAPMCVTTLQHTLTHHYHSLCHTLHPLNQALYRRYILILILISMSSNGRWVIYTRLTPHLDCGSSPVEISFFVPVVYSVLGVLSDHQ